MSVNRQLPSCGRPFLNPKTGYVRVAGEPGTARVQLCDPESVSRLVRNYLAIAHTGLAPGTMSITAGVVRDGLMYAVGALVAMAAEGSGTAAQDGIEHRALRPG